jgi:hypothetical protein
LPRQKDRNHVLQTSLAKQQQLLNGYHFVPKACEKTRYSGLSPVITGTQFLHDNGVVPVGQIA